MTDPFQTRRLHTARPIRPGRRRLRAALVVIPIVVGSCSSSDDAAPTSLTPTSPNTVADQAATRSLSLVGLGDSVMEQGAGDHSSFVDRFARQLEAAGAAAAVDVSNYASGALTAASLAIDIKQEPLRSEVARADIVVISVGGNDSDPFASYPAGTCAPTMAPESCLAAYAPTLAANYDAILAEVATLRAGKRTVVRIMTDYNPFPGWSEAPSATFGADFYAQVAAAQLGAACEAASRHGAQCVDVFHLFNGPTGTDDAARFLAGDHAHPGEVGLQAIAEALANLGTVELSG